MVRTAFSLWLLSLGIALSAENNTQLAILNNTGETALVTIDDDTIEIFPRGSHYVFIPRQGSLRLRVFQRAKEQYVNGFEQTYAVEIEQEIQDMGHNQHLEIYPSRELFDLQSVAPAA